MSKQQAVEERVSDLEQVIIKQADRIAALEEELSSMRQILVRTNWRAKAPEAAANISKD